MKNGDILRQLMKERGYTQALLAEKTGLSQSYISKLCRSDCLPSMESAQKIANVLNISIDSLVSAPPDINHDQILFEVSFEEKSLLLKLRQLSPIDRSAVFAVVNTYHDLRKKITISSHSQEIDAS